LLTFYFISKIGTNDILYLVLAYITKTNIIANLVALIEKGNINLTDDINTFSRVLELQLLTLFSLKQNVKHFAI
jgi:hypothetical protein